VANLFPLIEVVEETAVETSTENIPFGRSWKFDFELGEFAMTPTGKVARSEGTDAWLEWCKKAVQTERYRYLAYSRDYGQEYNDLIGSALSRPALESEIQRMTKEALMADERTASVSDIIFKWENERCYFTCTVSNVLEETGTIEESVVMI
jgi:hypothetical protein